MSYKEINDDLTTIQQKRNDDLTIIQQKIDTLAADVEKNRVIIRAHPVIFVALIVFFFITMDLWTYAVHSTIKSVHPRGALYFWEYILLALGSLLLLAWISHRYGIQLPMLGR